MICIAPHKCSCQRKLCPDCLYDHGIEVKQAVPIQTFQNMALGRLKELEPIQISEITKQRKAFKSMISQTEDTMKKIWETLLDSIKLTLDWIEKESLSLYNLVDENTDLAESSYTLIEKLVVIVQGKIDFNSWKNSAILELEQIRNRYDQDIKAFVQMQNEMIKKIESFIKQKGYTSHQTQSNEEDAKNQYQQEILNTIRDTSDWKNLKIKELNKLESHDDKVFSVCTSPDDATLASGGGSADSQKKGGNFIYFWDVKPGLQKFKLEGHTKTVRQVCFSPVSTTLASCSSDYSVRLWDAITGEQKAKLDGHNNSVYSVCFSPDGNTLASCSSDYSVRLWDVITGQQKAKLDGHNKTVYSVCFSPDGITLVSCSEDKSIRLWDVKTREQKAELYIHSKSVLSVCFSPDGATLASGSYDNSVSLLDFKTGQQQFKLIGHSRTVLSVCFSPNGSILASGSWDNLIFLWDVKTGQQKAKLDGHLDRVWSVCFSPNGNTLASGSQDSSIRLWEIKLDK